MSFNSGSTNTTLNNLNADLSEYQTSYETISNNIKELKNNMNVVSSELNNLLTTNIAEYTALYQKLIEYKSFYDNIINNISSTKDKITRAIDDLESIKNNTKNKQVMNNIIVIYNNYLDLDELYDELSIGLDSYWDSYTLSFTQSLYKNLFTVYISKFKTNINKINFKQIKGNKSTQDLALLNQYKNDIAVINTYLQDLQQFWSLGSGSIPLKNNVSANYITKILKDFQQQLSNIEISIDDVLQTTQSGLKNNVQASIITIRSSLQQLLTKLLSYMDQLKELSSNSNIQTSLNELQTYIKNLESKGTKVNTATEKNISNISVLLGETKQFKSTLSNSLQQMISKIQTELNSTQQPQGQTQEQQQQSFTPVPNNLLKGNANRISNYQMQPQQQEQQSQQQTFTPVPNNLLKGNANRISNYQMQPQQQEQQSQQQTFTPVPNNLLQGNANRISNYQMQPQQQEQQSQQQTFTPVPNNLLQGNANRISNYQMQPQQQEQQSQQQTFTPVPNNLLQGNANRISNYQMQPQQQENPVVELKVNAPVTLSNGKEGVVKKVINPNNVQIQTPNGTEEVQTNQISQINGIKLNGLKGIYGKSTKAGNNILYYSNEAKTKKSSSKVKRATSEGIYINNGSNKGKLISANQRYIPTQQERTERFVPQQQI